MKIPDTEFEIGDEVYVLYQKVRQDKVVCIFCGGAGRVMGKIGAGGQVCSKCKGAGGRMVQKFEGWDFFPQAVKLEDVMKAHEGGIWSETYKMTIEGRTGFSPVKDLFATLDGAKVERDKRNEGKEKKK